MIDTFEGAPGVPGHRGRGRVPPRRIGSDRGGIDFRGLDPCMHGGQVIAWTMLLGAVVLLPCTGCFGVRLHDPARGSATVAPWHGLGGFSPETDVPCERPSLAKRLKAGPLNRWRSRPAAQPGTPVPHSKFHPVPVRPAFSPFGLATVPLAGAEPLVDPLAERPAIPSIPTRTDPLPEPTLDPSEPGPRDLPPARLSREHTDQASPIR